MSDMRQTALDAATFADMVEALIRSAEPNPHQDDGDFAWDFHGALLDLIERMMSAAGQQDPHPPGKLRIDAGTSAENLPGLVPNADAEIVVDFDFLSDEGNHRFWAKYNLADELIRYAERGEEGWDIARQIVQLERTIARLRTAAAERGWALPPVH